MGIGRHSGIVGGIPLEVLTWYDAQGDRPSLEELEQQERQRAEQEHQRAELLREQLRALGVDPEV